LGPPGAWLGIYSAYQIERRPTSNPTTGT